VLTEPDIDMTRFPIPTYSTKDVGSYITAGNFCMSNDPEIGVSDLWHYRF